MNNPRDNRETWREFEQYMQDFVLEVIDIAEDQYTLGGHYCGFSDKMQADLIEWVEDRFLDGRNFRDAEDEFFAWDDHWDTITHGGN